jgi:anti-sigma28 factor (negative regulator of flagellin synthesis)
MVRIGSSGIDNLGGGQVGSVGGVGTDTRYSGASASQKSDSVSLSGAASLVALAKSGAASRQSKIQSLSVQVKSGSYQADTAQISHAVVQSHISG